MARPKKVVVVERKHGLLEEENKKLKSNYNELSNRITILNNDLIESCREVYELKDELTKVNSALASCFAREYLYKEFLDKLLKELKGS